MMGAAFRGSEVPGDLGQLLSKEVGVVQTLNDFAIATPYALPATGELDYRQ